MPRVSVIMAAYNAAPYIGAAVGCLVAQTLGDWELIVADDGSTDDTAAIVESLAARDSRIHLLQLPHTGSPYAVRRRAVQEAAGQWIFPFDADDLLDADFLARLVGRADRCPDAEMILCALHVFSGEDAADARQYVPVPGVDAGRVYTCRELLPLTLGQWQIAGNGLFDAALFRRGIALTEPYADNPFADELLLRVMLTQGSRAVIEPARYLYRMQAGSVTHRASCSRYRNLQTDMAMYRLLAAELHPALHRHLYDGIVCALLRLGREGWPADCTCRELDALLRRAYDCLDFDSLAGSVSGPVFRIMRLGYRPARTILTAYGRLKG